MQLLLPVSEGLGFILLYFFGFFVCLFVLHGVSLCNPGLPRAHDIDQVFLEFGECQSWLPCILSV